MPDEIEIQPIAGELSASIRPPGSKSITNRALVCAALAEGGSTLSGALDSEDTRVMIDALGQLGIAVQVRDDGTTLLVQGCGGAIPAAGGELFVANSGTTMRFLTALVTLGHGVFRLSGIERMHERPIGDLLDALNQLGANVRSETANDCPPVVVTATGLPGGRAEISGSISSQYLSALLMAAPYAQSPVELAVSGTLVSQPYVTMTLRVMESFGIHATSANLQRFEIDAPHRYAGRTYAIEPDASAASYFFAAAAIAGGTVRVEGLSRDSLQGDVAFVDCLAQMGCAVESLPDAIIVRNQQKLRGIDVDMNAISDTVQTLAAVAVFAEGTTTIRGAAHIRHKETDRIGDLARELRKLGATVDEHHDGMTITPAVLHGAAIDTYNDHRMAMSLALVGLKCPGVVIRNPGCTAKTYPHFFRDLDSLRISS